MSIECRMTQSRITNAEFNSTFGNSSFIRHSSFDIRHSWRGSRGVDPRYQSRPALPHQREMERQKAHGRRGPTVGFMINDGRSIGWQALSAQATPTAKNRRANRIARCLAYQCRLTGSIECRRFRLPSGMAFPSISRVRCSFPLQVPAKSKRVCYASSGKVVRVAARLAG